MCRENFSNCDICRKEFALGEVQHYETMHPTERYYSTGGFLYCAVCYEPYVAIYAAEAVRREREKAEWAARMIELEIRGQS
jgi:hypothetical protein